MNEPTLIVPFGAAAKLPCFSCVAAGENFSAALSSEGEVYSWGSCENGRLGRPPYAQAEPRVIPSHVFGGKRVAKLALGWRHALACTTVGELYSWGCNGSGQLGVGEIGDAAQPLLVEPLCKEAVSCIAAGAAHSVSSSRLSAQRSVLLGGEDSSGENRGSQPLLKRVTPRVDDA